MAALDEILSDLADLGWLVSNAYQHDDTTWRANLRTEPQSSPDGAPSTYHATTWAEAPTLELALLMCMDKLEQAEAFTDQPQSSSIDPSPVRDSIPRPSLSTLLTNLRPTPSIPRRL